MTISTSGQGGPAEIAPEHLSARELEIMTRICRGDSNVDIAGELYLSINTVKTHIRSAYRRIGITRRVEAVLWGAQHGLVPHEQAGPEKVGVGAG